jgi:hypothetical protein
MGRYDPLPFSPGYRFRTIKPLTYNGVDYTADADFPGAGQPAVEETLLRKLYTQRRITPLHPLDHDGDGVKGGAVAQAEAVEPQEPVLDPEPATEPEGAPEPTEGGEAGALTMEQLHADLEALGIAIDPALSYDELLAARDAARAERPADHVPPADKELADETAASGALTKVHLGFGKYAVRDAHGAELATGLSKAEADAMLK